MIVSCHVIAGWGLSFLQDELERRVFSCMCCICHLGCRFKSGHLCAMSLFPGYSGFYQIGVTGPRHVPGHDESTSIFNFLPSWLQRSRGSYIPWVVSWVCPCFPCSKSSLTWKQGEKTLRSRPMWSRFSVSCVHLHLPSQFWGQSLLCGSISLWGDHSDYRSLIKEALYQELINCESWC